ncbi:hypothetical protein [Treponema sp.]|uniref:hypothetical protein n=1 Tax=Treponema sp. TaxID=166 RepID=UPI00298E9B68|nr:hypothetical protein [Treponema sp.]MCR5612613.1 hypothetical protein [Treponema sp.]
MYFARKKNHFYCSHPSAYVYGISSKKLAEVPRYNQNLPGVGGIYNHINCNIYAYAANNPIRYIDPDGRDVILLNRSWEVPAPFGPYGHNAYRVETSYDEDLNMIQTGKEIINRKYSLVETEKNGETTQNCADLTYDIISSVPRLSITNVQISNLKWGWIQITWPNAQYNAFKNNNKGAEESIFDEHLIKERKREYMFNWNHKKWGDCEKND